MPRFLLTAIFFFAALLCIFAAPIATAKSTSQTAAPLIGSPPVELFTPGLEIYPRNFCVAQDRNGIVYICASQGVIEFDGERWRLLQLPNGLTHRSIGFDADGTMFVGGYNIFGMLERNQDGTLKYVDLTERYRQFIGTREVADIWEVEVTSEGVYFRALRDVFFWDRKRDRIAHWFHEGRFGLVIEHQGRTMLQFRGEGFKIRQGDQWVLQPETAPVHRLAPIVLPTASGGVLMGTVDNEWFFWHQGSLKKPVLPDFMPAPNQVLRVGKSLDGKFLLCGRDGRLFVVEQDLSAVRIIRLGGGNIVNASTALDGSLLAATQLGLYRADTASGWQVLASEANLAGSLFSFNSWNGRYFANTSSGSFEATQSATGLTFNRKPWGNRGVHALLGIDEHRVLVADAHDLHVVDRRTNASLTVARGVYVREFYRSKFVPNRAYLATEHGLRILDMRDGRFTVSPGAENDRGNLIESLVEISATELWSGSYRHGAWRFTQKPGETAFQSEAMNASRGLVLGSGGLARVAQRADGSIIANTLMGSFRWSGTKFEPVEIENLSRLRAPSEVLHLARAPDGTEWAYSMLRVFRRDAFDRDAPWRVLEVRSLRRGSILGHQILEDGRFVLVCSNALLVYQPTPTTRAEGRSFVPKVVLRSAELIDQNGNGKTLPLLSGKGQVSASAANVRFQFALPEYVREGIKRYRTQLVGFDTMPSAWGFSSQITYTSLPAGTYKFEVTALDSLGNISTSEPYTLVVVPQWYARWWAQLLWLVMALCALAAVILAVARYRTRLLAAENLKLEAKVEERTRELADANRRLDMMAHADGLTGIANRRRLDEYLPVVWEACAQHQRSIAVLVIDVDHFKQFNDTYGHLAGDELLKRLAQVLTRGLRRSEDLLARYGGEEFQVVLPGADLALAAELAETLRRDVEKSTLGATISIGVCSAVPSANGGSFADLVAAADAALYRAKHQGRNRVVLCESAQGAGTNAS